MSDFFEPIRNYTEARRRFDAAIPYKGTNERPYNRRALRHQHMIEEPDGSITLRYMGMPIITYHPNGEVTSHGAQQIFQGRVLTEITPLGLMLCNPESRIGPTLLLAPEGQCHPGNGWWRSFPYWVAKDKSMPEGWGNHVSNPDVLVVRNRKPVRLRYCGDRLEPVDESSLEPFKWQQVNRKRARAVATEWGIPGLVAWKEALEGLGEWVEPEKTDNDDPDAVLDLLKANRFAEAMAVWPRLRYYYSFNSTLNQLRTYLYMREDATDTVEKRILTLPEKYTVKSLLNRFQTTC